MPAQGGSLHDPSSLISTPLIADVTSALAQTSEPSGSHRRKLKRPAILNPKGSGKRGHNDVKKKLSVWTEHDSRDEIAFLKDYESLFPNRRVNSLNTERITTFHLWVQDNKYKARIQNYFDRCAEEGVKPKWNGVRSAFLIGNQNVRAILASSLPVLQTLKQLSSEDPEEFLQRIRAERTRLLDIAKRDLTPGGIGHSVPASLCEGSTIQIFLAGLNKHHSTLQKNVMRKTIPHGANRASVSTLTELDSLLSIEMAVSSISANNDLNNITLRSSRKRHTPDPRYSMYSEQDADVHFNLVRSHNRDAGKNPGREVHEETSKSFKETSHKNTQIWDEDSEEPEIGAESPKRSKPSKKRKSAVALKPQGTIINESDSEQSDDSDEAKAKTLDKAKEKKKRDKKIAKGKTLNDLGKSVRLLQAKLNSLSTTTGGNQGTTPKPFEKGGKGNSVRPPTERGGKGGPPYQRLTPCWGCCEEFEKVWEHDCEGKRKRELWCPHCKTQIVTPHLTVFMEHIASCTKRYCKFCKTSSHSNYWCPNSTCTVCGKQGHPQVLHKFGKQGEDVILRCSTH